ncbi:MAG: phosphoribosylanthranilate isomerase [Rhodospirillaceae bacterium]
MTATQVKICGLNDETGLAAAVQAGADMVGFVFFERSPRHVTPLDAANLMDGLPFADEGGPLRVGLLVDPDEQTLAAVVGQTRLDFLQLHGNESPERASQISRDWGLPVMKALPIATAEDLARAKDYGQAVDLLLLDAKPPKGADRPGGHATAFDWALLEGWSAPLPWLLAGGLTPETVADAIRQTNAPGVDVSSGVEAAKGVKDPDKIAAFVAAVDAASA